MSITEFLIYILLVLAAMSQGLALYAAFSTLRKVKASTARVAEMAARAEEMTAAVYAKVNPAALL